MANDTTTPGTLVPTSAPPADDASLEAILQTLITGITGLPGNLVRPRWQPTVPQQPDPSVTWCALGVVSVTADDYPAVLHNRADAAGLGTDTLYRHESLEVLLSFYGPQGQALAEQTRDGLAVAPNNDTLAVNLMAFSGLSDPLRSVPELVNQQWRRRYDFTATFHRQIVRTYGVRTLVAAELDLFTDRGEVAAAIVTAH